MVQVTSSHFALFLVKHFSSKVHSKVHLLDHVCKQCRGAESFDATDPGVKRRPYDHYISSNAFTSRSFLSIAFQAHKKILPCTYQAILPIISPTNINKLIS